MKIIQLETERLILRELMENDAEEMYKNWASDDEVSKYVRWSTHKNVEETKEYLKTEQERCRTENYYNWGIVLKEKNELIGAIGAFPSEDNRIEIGYNLSKKHWRNGYTTEALKKVLRYLINEKNIYRFICSHAVLNPASGTVMRKAGFKYVYDDICEKYDGSQKFDTKVYHLDIDKIKLIKPTKEQEEQIMEYKNEHIGYGVRPGERKKGYATQMLEQALVYCKEKIKLEKVMVNCHKENEASRKTIVNAGGKLEREYQRDDGKIVQIYWINF